MHENFPKDQYGQRWQVESAISRDKRLFGSAVRATSWSGQKREAYLRILVHNLLILSPFGCHGLFNRAGMTQNCGCLTRSGQNAYNFGTLWKGRPNPQAVSRYDGSACPGSGRGGEAGRVRAFHLLREVSALRPREAAGPFFLVAFGPGSACRSAGS